MEDARRIINAAIASEREREMRKGGERTVKKARGGGGRRRRRPLIRRRESPRFGAAEREREREPLPTTLGLLLTLPMDGEEKKYKKGGVKTKRAEGSLRRGEN